ncbi:MAG: DNA primase [Proteobacteria bacterium]|nr:DNA primase [Pseudomonadota bacterium]MBU1640095.1 DNA primase [Pseudomonadota bacterium]
MADLHLIKKESKEANAQGGGGGIDSKFVMECLNANELGDGMLYAALHKDQFVFAKNFDCWFAWDKHSWIPDDLDWAVAAVENVALRYAEEVTDLWKNYGEAMAKGDDGKDVAKVYKAKIDAIKQRVSRLRKDSGRSNCLKFAHTNPVNPLSIRGDEFDSNPWLLAVQNGVIDLKSGELEDGRPEDYISKRCAVPYPETPLSEVDFSLFDQTLEEIYGGNKEEIAYMQRLYGYGITGTDSEHVFPVLIGKGRNGKSIVMEALSHVLGDYAGPVPSEMLLDGNRTQAGGSDPSLMALKGLRLAIASETDEGRKFSPSKVKWLTGGDAIIARGLYDKKLTKFLPTHLLILLTNHEPTPPATDFAFWERCWLIKHNYSFVVRDADEPLLSNERPANKHLPEQLRKIGPAILAWLVKGCLEWQHKGLAPPKSVKKSTADYQDDENYISQFLEAACVTDTNMKISASDLYTAFQHWYQATINKNERYTPAQKKFGRQIIDTDRFERYRSGGYYHYKGLSVKPEYQKVIDENADK